MDSRCLNASASPSVLYQLLYQTFELEEEVKQADCLIRAEVRVPEF